MLEGVPAAMPMALLQTSAQPVELAPAYPRLPQCPKDCSAHGHCYLSRGGQSACACLAGWGGSACEKALPSKGAAGAAYKCPSACSQHGVCTASGCSCYPGWSG